MAKKAVVAAAPRYDDEGLALELVQQLIRLTRGDHLKWRHFTEEDYHSSKHIIPFSSTQYTFESMVGGVTFSLVCSPVQAVILSVGYTGMQVASSRATSFDYQPLAVRIPPQASVLADPLDVLRCAILNKDMEPTGLNRILDAAGLVEELSLVGATGVEDTDI